MDAQHWVGKSVPDVNFKVRDESKWITLRTSKIFAHKKIILFALPGAFTPTCSSVHLPNYEDYWPSFKALGIDEVYCLSVNDSFVMNEWRKREKIQHVKMLPDGNGEFTEKMGLLVDQSELCFGNRSRRYSMLINDGIIEKAFLEPLEGNDPYGVSGPETMLTYLDPNVCTPQSLAIFTREGCPYCARAKDLMQERGLKYEEHVLLENFSIKTLKAISGSTSVPQIFIDGKRVGGCEDLEKLLGSSGLKEVREKNQSRDESHQVS